MAVSKKSKKKTFTKSKFSDILILSILIFEICLLGYYFFIGLKQPMHLFGYLGFFIIILLISLFALINLIFNFAITDWIKLNIIKLKIWKYISKLFKREEFSGNYFYKYVFKNLVFSISFVLALALLFSLNLLPVLNNVFHKPSVAIAIILVVYFGTLFLQMNVMSIQTFLNRNRIYWYILNFGILYYFWRVVEIHSIICTLFLLLIIVELWISSKKTDLNRYWEIVLLSIIVFILGVVLLAGLFSMDYTASKNQILSLSNGKDSIICSSGNDFNLILENSLIDCNIQDHNILISSISVYHKSVNSIVNKIKITHSDENKLIIYVPQNTYEFKIISNNREYISKNLKLMTIEDYEHNRQEFGKYFFLLLGVVFLTIPAIIKAHTNIRKEIKQ